MLFLLNYGGGQREALKGRCRKAKNRRSGMMKTFRFWLLASMLAMVVLAGCNPQRGAVKAERLQERIEKKQKKEQAAAYEEARKRHVKLQSKETRRRMRDSAKRSEKWRGGRKASWWKRLFGKTR